MRHVGRVEAELISPQVFGRLRLLRVFRVFKLARYLSEATALRRALWASRAKIIVFITSILIVVVIMGSAMHLVEGDEAGFTSIPQSMYWAIVTMTTVGYGDISPETAGGRVVAILLMLMGIGLIGAFTGLVASYIIEEDEEELVSEVARIHDRLDHIEAALGVDPRQVPSIEEED